MYDSCIFCQNNFQTKHLSCSLQQYIYSVIWVFFFVAFAVFFNPKDRNFLILHYSFSFSKLFNHFTGFLRAFLLKFFTRIFFLFQFQFVSFIHAAFRIWKNNSFTTELCIAQEAFKYHALDRSIFSYLNLPYFSIFTIFFEKMEKASLFSCHHRIYFLFDIFFANFWKSTMNSSKKFSS